MIADVILIAGVRAFWRRQVAAYKARARRQAMLRGEPVEPPRALTLKERLAATEPEIKRQEKTA